MNLVKLIEQTVTENQIPPIQKDAKYFQNLDYRQAIHSGRVKVKYDPVEGKTRPFTPEELQQLPKLTPQEEAELLAHEMERGRQDQARRRDAQRQQTVYQGRDPL